MKINEKQYNYLKILLKNYKLKKNIDDLTQFEAAIAIEGIVNGGKVKDHYKGKKISEDDLKKRQSFFDGLVEAKSSYASEKQLIYIKDLCKISKYELIDSNILREDVNSIILLLRDNLISDTALKYLKEAEGGLEGKLIKIKEEPMEEKINLPEDWIPYNVELNGIIDFEK